jgi:hypothetical protein
MRFSGEVAAKAVKAANGELAWNKDDVRGAMAELVAANHAVLRG